MIAADAEVLARLRLVQGRSDTEVQEFASAPEGTPLITVGSDPSCDWQVQEAGVAPNHFTLHWDGSILHIADTQDAGKVRVDGALLGPEWRRLSGRSRIEFGRAAIVAEFLSPSRATQPPAMQPPRPQDLPLGTRDSTGAHPAYVEKRTIEGYVVQPGSDQSAISVSEGPSERSRGSSPRPEPGPKARHAETSGSALTIHRPPRSGPEMRLPSGVLVLTPMGETPATQEDERPSFGVPAAPELPGWRPITLGVLALAGGYAGWVYLLYHL